MSNEKQESIADIVAALRAIAYIQTAESPSSVLSFANRIESAAKRERKAGAEAAQICGEIGEMVGREATREKYSQVGNAAAMREALEYARRFVSASAQRTDRDLLIMDEKRGAYVLTPKETLIKIDAALSAPPRNCDIMDWRTAWAKWRTECHPQKPCGYAEVVSGTEQFMDWYMSEAKGEAK